MRVLVIGDRIIDQYQWCRAIKLAPEACAPVLQIERENATEGGAGLVASQLYALWGCEYVDYLFGSVSTKHRVFAERTLICRIDRDSQQVTSPKDMWEQIGNVYHNCDAIVISDYGKGTFTEALSRDIINLGFPTFVDSKHHIEWWKGAEFIFPNEHEHVSLNHGNYLHVIRKLGAKGCSVNGRLVPTNQQDVYDVTGAGDIFMAAFVYKYLTTTFPTVAKDLLDAAAYANLLAGISVKHMGTHVVQPDEIPQGKLK